jgi:hypothetical protein
MDLKNRVCYACFLRDKGKKTPFLISVLGGSPISLFFITGNSYYKPGLYTPTSNNNISRTSS